MRRDAWRRGAAARGSLRELAQLLPERRILASRETWKVFQFVGQSVRPPVRHFATSSFRRAASRAPCDFAHGGAQAIGRNEHTSPACSVP